MAKKFKSRAKSKRQTIPKEKSQKLISKVPEDISSGAMAVRRLEI